MNKVDKEKCLYDTLVISRRTLDEVLDISLPKRIRRFLENLHIESFDTIMYTELFIGLDIDNNYTVNISKDSISVGSQRYSLENLSSSLAPNVKEEFLGEVVEAMESILDEHSYAIIKIHLALNKFNEI